MSDHIPNWLLPEILCMLLVESLLRFRCVSKQWYSLITSPHFISLFTSAASAPPLLLLPTSPPNLRKKKTMLLASQEMEAYDPERREFKDLDIHGWSESFFLRKYVESLVLLDGSSGAKVDPSIASESEEATEL
ncbi:hypothetical protein HAX54_014623 [Datura stramonium]|uniref:F-box domain-containing protein n=1 Tax=Datura stramonium TaxID=4076 RepID=A0ABS8TND3_DATST|nr:hypothetical protein [Datura stramonium]